MVRVSSKKLSCSFWISRPQLSKDKIEMMMHMTQRVSRIFKPEILRK